MSTSSADSPSSPDPAQTVQDKQQQDAERLLKRLAQVDVQDLAIHYTLHNASVTLPAALIRLVVVAVLFRLDSMKKWDLVLSRNLLSEPVRQRLHLGCLAELADQATVDWIPPKILLDTLAWQVSQCLTQCALPQPAAVIRQTIAVLLLRDAKQCGEGITLNRSFWRRVCEKGRRP